MIVSCKTIGNNIRNARSAANLTQEQTAELLKISQLHFGRMERGERPASLEQLAKIARVLGVSLSSLLNGCVEGEDFEFQPQDGAKSLGRAVESVANGCSPTARQLMYDVCQTIANHDKGISGK